MGILRQRPHIFQLKTAARVVACQGQPPASRTPQSLISLPREPRLQPATAIVIKRSVHWLRKLSSPIISSLERFRASMSPKRTKTFAARATGVLLYLRSQLSCREPGGKEGCPLARHQCGIKISYLRSQAHSSVCFPLPSSSRLFCLVETSIYNQVSNINNSL